MEFIAEISPTSTVAEGIILNQEGRGEQSRVEVNFKKFGAKWLMLAHAKLEAI